MVGHKTYQKLNLYQWAYRHKLHIKCSHNQVLSRNKCGARELLRQLCAASFSLITISMFDGGKKKPRKKECIQNGLTGRIRHHHCPRGSINWDESTRPVSSESIYFIDNALSVSTPQCFHSTHKALGGQGGQITWVSSPHDTPRGSSTDLKWIATFINCFFFSIYKTLISQSCLADSGE